MFHDAANGLIWAENRDSLGAGETLMAKNALNKGYGNWLLPKFTNCIVTMGFFNPEFFVEDCKNKYQTQSFSGVGDHHKNALTE